MTSTTVWISSDEARILRFTTRGIEKKSMHKHGPRHHAETVGRNHTKAGDDTDRFMREVAEAVLKESDDRLLIVGPGLAKNRFKNAVEAEFPQQMKRIVGFETMDKATDGQIADFSHEFFKKMGSFEPL